MRLAIYPALHIADLFVCPSVGRDQLEVRVWTRNAGPKDQRVTLRASLAAWQGGTWKYPEFPAVETVVPPPQRSKELTLGPVKWGLGPESYWWPNIPFRDDYRATLHWLSLAVSVDGKVSARAAASGSVSSACRRPLLLHRQRRALHELRRQQQLRPGGRVRLLDRDALLPAAARRCKGCWRPGALPADRLRIRMRLSTSRAHAHTCWKRPTRPASCSIPRAARGATAPRSSISSISGRSCRRRSAPAAIIRAWPATRWPTSRCPRGSKRPIAPGRGLIDAAREADDTRPLVFEVNPGIGTGPVPGMKGGRAADAALRSGRSRRRSSAQAWANAPGPPKVWGPSPTWRRRCGSTTGPISPPGAGSTSGRTSLEGMNHQRHPWKTNDHDDRTDRVDGWDSPIVTSVQRALHPYLVLDRAGGGPVANPPAACRRANRRVAPPASLPGRQYGRAGRRVVQRRLVGTGARTALAGTLGHARRRDPLRGSQRTDRGRAPVSTPRAPLSFPCRRPSPAREKLCLVLDPSRQERWCIVTTISACRSIRRSNPSNSGSITPDVPNPSKAQRKVMTMSNRSDRVTRRRMMQAGAEPSPPLPPAVPAPWGPTPVPAKRPAKAWSARAASGNRWSVGATSR